MTDDDNKPDDDNVVEMPKADAQPAQPSQEEIVAHQQMAAHLAGMIAPFCPNMDEPSLLKLAGEGIVEQSQIHEMIMPTLMPNHPQCKEYPSVRAVLRGPNGKEGAVAAPKRLEDVEDPQPAMSQALVVSLLLTPSARMVLRAWGFQVRFEQMQQDVSKPTPTIHRV
jgi:hypothetical protein